MNKNINNLNSKEVNWKYFPNTFQLSQYLLQSDLIQLSLTCSQLRGKLNSIIFAKLKLFNDGVIFHDKDNELSQKQPDIIVDILEKDYYEKYHFVKHCILMKPCRNTFNTKFFNMFSYISKLELHLHTIGITNFAPNNENSFNLTNILKPLKYLEFLKLDSKLIIFSENDKLSNFKLPTCLRVLRVVGLATDILSFGPMENISDEYTKLREVTIINNSMLNGLTLLMNSLTEVAISSNQYFCPKLLSKFFSLNPQLEKVSVTPYFIEFNDINPILQLKNLRQFNITYSNDTVTKDLNDLTTNTSIKHLCIECELFQDMLLPILASLKSLHTLELAYLDFYDFKDIYWHSYYGKIPLLHINCAYNTEYSLGELLNLEVFDRIRFSENYDLEYYIESHRFDEYDNWEIVNDDPLDKAEFSLVRKY